MCGIGVVDIGFAASARWQPVEKAELTSKVIAKIILKLIALAALRNGRECVLRA